MPEKTLNYILTRDERKKLKEGKRRYGDGEGHTLYLMGDEVQLLDDPLAIAIVVTVETPDPNPRSDDEPGDEVAGGSGE